MSPLRFALTVALSMAAAGPLLAGEPGADTRASTSNPSPVPGTQSVPRTTVLAPIGPTHGALPATVLAPDRGALPVEMANTNVELDVAEPLPFASIARRIALLAGVPSRIEERPSRIAGAAVTPPPSRPLTLVHSGSLVDLLDLASVRSGYSWDWDVEGRSLVWYRYWDREQPLPLPAAASLEGLWTVNPARHKTVQGVLEAWGRRAGWQIRWQATKQFAVKADARFLGNFLRAADQLLSASEIRRALSATVYHANRWIVVKDAGA